MHYEDFDETVPSKPEKDEPEQLDDTQRSLVPELRPMDATQPSKRFDPKSVVPEREPLLAETPPPADPEPEPEAETVQTAVVEEEDTDEIEIQDMGEAQEEGEPEKKRQWMRRAGIGVAIFLLVVALGGFVGYQTGLGDRRAAEEIRDAAAAAEQFELAKQDMAEGRYSVAIQRLEYVIRLNPTFPGAAEQLAIALLAMNSTATPTTVPTQTLTPTPDIRDQEALFQQALSYASAEDWDNLLITLDSLRKIDQTYRAVDVDGLYYIGLRNRGVDRILNQGDLEGGIFDLGLAEQFAPIDVQANSYRQWAEWYITGASFWEVDWGQVITYFEYIVPLAPNLSDPSGFTVSQRLSTAQVFYATQAILEGDAYLANREWCAAHQRFQYVADTVGLGEDVQPTADWAAFKCELYLEESGGN